MHHITLISGPRRSGKTTIAKALSDRHSQGRPVILVDEDNVRFNTVQSFLNAVRGKECHIILVGERISYLTELYPVTGVNWENVFEIRTNRGFVAGS